MRYNEELAHFLAKDICNQIDLILVHDDGGDTQIFNSLKETHLEKIIKKFLDKRQEL